MPTPFPFPFARALRFSTAAARVRVPRAAAMVWGLALWLALVGNLPLWQRIDGLGGSLGYRVVLIAGLGALLTCAIAALLWLFAWPRVFRPVASVLLVVAGANSYFMWRYGVVMDPTMLANTLHTDVREVRDLMSWSLLGALLLVAGLPLWALWRQPRFLHGGWRRVGHNAAGLLAAFALLVVTALMSYQGLASLMRNHKDLRYMANPLNSVYAATWVAAERLPRQAKPLLPVGEDARLGASYDHQARPPLLLLVIGETARAQNFGLNGYARDTTPALARWRAGGDLVNFSQVRSCGTNTLVSVPCLFSPLSRTQGGNQPADRENLLDVLQRAGLAVLWIDNQAGCKGVCNRVPHVYTNDQPVPALCPGGECLDAAMLDGLDARLEALDPARRARGVVLVMHQMGSHGPAYAARSPDGAKPFLPECRSNALPECSQQELVNAYDNSIAYTDRFLDQALQWLSARAAQGRNDTGLVYVSDHGESLGENGLYLHGVPYALAPDQQTHVPMVAWFSSGLRQRAGLSLDCLRARSAEPLSHDNVFHTVLGLMDVRTGAREPALDALAPCSSGG
ncbi:phosphoethanolamine transferase [Hydrogenophaga borbori]|uniref:phosphoethanolamine transferase n=1 Tax=Hydrogenophaga borbori TaxID=2294117 RepID=UPI00301C94D6